MTLAVLAPPATPAIALAEVKAHLRLEGGHEDAYLASLVEAATALVEHRTGCALTPRTLRLYLDDWPASAEVALPARPVTGLVAVTAYEAGGVPVPLPPEATRLMERDGLTRLLLPARPADGVPHPLEIDFTAGHAEGSLPPLLARALLVLVAHWHGLRGAAPPELLTGLIPAGLDGLLAPHRPVRL